MTRRTSVSLSEKGLNELNKFQSQIIILLEGKSIDKSKVISLLIAGYKNPEFNELQFLDEMTNQEITA